MANIDHEETDLYRIYIDRKGMCPALRIEWKIKSDMLPTFLQEISDWEKAKVYDYMRNYIYDNKLQIVDFYKKYNNEEGINYLKQLI